MAPIAEMGLPIKAESRTGDTGIARRQRQRVKPPDMLLTTPEQLALFCAWEGARRYFEDLRCVIIDEVHAIWPSKRGDLLSLGLARLQQFAPDLRRVGLSATVDDPGRDPALAVADDPGRRSIWCAARAGAPPVVDVLLSEGQVPWAGHTAQHAMPEVYEAIKRRADRAGLRQHPLPGRVRLPGAVAAQRGQPADRPAPRLARGRAAAQGRGGDGARARCGPWSAPRRSTSASTGATSTWSSSWPRRRAPRGWCSGSAAPTTGWTSPAAPSSCRPTASRCWNARPRARRSPRTPSTPSRSATARSTCWPSTSWACACSEPFDLRGALRRGPHRRALPRPRLGGLRGGGRFRLHRRLRAARPTTASRAS